MPDNARSDEELSDRYREWLKGVGGQTKGIGKHFTAEEIDRLTVLRLYVAPKRVVYYDWLSRLFNRWIKRKDK